MEFGRAHEFLRVADDFYLEGVFVGGNEEGVVAGFADIDDGFARVQGFGEARQLSFSKSIEWIKL